jgi:glycerol-3-phosphate O-acyltransferase
MDKTAITEFMQKYGEELVRNSRERQDVDPNAVFQPANLKNRPIIEKILEALQLPGSKMLHFDRLKELYDRSQQGESCLILSEHYSNFDIPNLFYLAHQYGEEGDKVINSIIPMAGRKLNAESRFVLAFTEAYTRIVIYPSRDLQKMEGAREYEEERKLSRAINRSALREMIRAKHAGHPILVFPAGTRYRPGVPESKQGLPEIDSYIKSFDQMLLIGIAGNVLQVDPTGNMEADIPKQDVVIYTMGEIIDCKRFREEARREGGFDEKASGPEAKQQVVGRVMQELDELHEEAEAERERCLAALKK